MSSWSTVCRAPAQISLPVYPLSLGETTASAFSLFWAGSESGLTNNHVDAFALVEPGRLLTPAGNQTIVVDACDGMIGAAEDDLDHFFDPSLFLPLVLR